MSFRSRLTLFFLVIVIVPMIAVAVVLFRLVGDSEEGKTDAQLGQAQRAASGLFDDLQRRAAAASRTIGGDEALAAAIQRRERAGVQDRLERLARRERTRRLVLRLDSLGRFEVGDAPALAPSRSRLTDGMEPEVGDLVVSMISAREYVELVRRMTGLDVVVTQPGGSLAATIRGVEGDTAWPLKGTGTVGGHDYRLTGFQAPAFTGPPVTVRLLADDNETDTTIGASSVLVGVALLGFLVLAFAFALTVSRSLQAQIQKLLVAAQRLGGGDFKVAVPAEGNDEFGALGREFNSMAVQLEARLQELQEERARLREAIRRVGESAASGLDRDALLEIVVQTAIDGVGAQCGRATVREHTGAPLSPVATAGEVASFEEAIRAVEAEVLHGKRAAEISVNGSAALAQPLRISQPDGRVMGVLSVARPERPFSEAEKELFTYLATQAAVSIENVDLHETVQRQAVTDELTGLFNHRRFQEVMATEVERSKRYGHTMGLIMLDLDDFKNVNDTYGHMQGDLVLREVARVLKETSREIDEPARYGGEEMAVALPQTNLDGAYRFAERVRKRIETLELPILDGTGTLRVTASLGAAAIDGSPRADKDALVAAADAALYRAKRAGKNRTMRADKPTG
jgi:diguanylate cyclase (GGDEF)-like protein